MNKIVISGYYGFNNLGDESILTAIIANLRSKIDNIEITVLSKDPNFTAKKHKVRSVNRMNVFKVINEIKKCDLLISGGGSLLQDVTSFRSIIYYLAVIFFGIVFNKKVMIYSQGMGPINRQINRWLTKKVLDKVDFISLRDYKSENLLKEIGVNNKNIIVTADPVLGLKQEDKELGKEILSKVGVTDFSKPTIGFAIRGRDKTQNTIDVMSEVANRLVEELEANVIFIPFHLGEDIDISKDIQEKTSEKVVFLKEKYNVNEMLSIIGNLNLLVGVRLHSLIFGAVMNTPLIAISYDPKINNFMEFIEEFVFCHINDLETESLFQEIKDKLFDEESFKLKLGQKVKTFRDALEKNEEIVNQLLNKD
ncbi:MAG: polysaccharide pyruvyl transferase CsaB [Tissierellia bacterium]|nr:polysaccharide pyruvyl transferase CsaB [Tissierellia bacterium]